MEIIKTKIKDLQIVKQKNNLDKRGSLKVIFNDKFFKNKRFKYEYYSLSKKNVIRGFHFQTKNQQIKYISVLQGKILDCVVDLRKNSKTFGKIFKIILSETNNKGLIIPRGFGHAYLSLSDESIVYYKMSDYFRPDFYSGIIFNDKKLKVNWPKKKFIISSKDLKLNSFSEFCFKYKGI